MMIHLASSSLQERKMASSTSLWQIFLMAKKDVLDGTKQVNLLPLNVIGFTLMGLPRPSSGALSLLARAGDRRTAARRPLSSLASRCSIALASRCDIALASKCWNILLLIILRLVIGII
ncbi:hypothetical protein SORBI_3010G207325 [Sorghum bicolor]|uniref:Uncharacterized protein n=1 Tax=Sorghum bicolor TaxID=4558 RepID=A0A1W0VU43_SORBI|nr:hypothetical protein SORBI_3010G207325 [Sorghum bicolor]